MEQKLTFTLHEMIWLMDSWANRELKSKFAISFPKFYVLAALAACEPTSQADLAESIGQSAAAVSKSLGVLEKDGYVRVLDDPANGRKNLVEVTDRGRRLLHEAGAHLERLFIARLHALPIDLDAYLKASVIIRDEIASMSMA